MYTVISITVLKSLFLSFFSSLKRYSFLSFKSTNDMLGCLWEVLGVILEVGCFVEVL